LKNRGGKRTLIVGAGNAGEMILRDMIRIYKMTWRYVGLYDFLSIFIATVIGKGGRQLPIIFSSPFLPGNLGTDTNKK
jgi:FlaA1/EpsC-like NDP-sugar epimerase